jgi:hypothetical protein
MDYLTVKGLIPTVSLTLFRSCGGVMTEGSMHVQPAAAPLLPSMTHKRLVDACHTAFDGSHVPPTANIVSSVCGMIGNAFTCLLYCLIKYKFLNKYTEHNLTVAIFNIVLRIRPAFKQFLSVLCSVARRTTADLVQTEI